MKKVPNWIYIVVAISLLIGSKFIFFSKDDDKGSRAKAKSSLPALVNYFVVQPVPLVNNLFAIGKVGSFNQIDVLPEVAGKINVIYCKEGEPVKKGDLLVKLNDADLQAQLLKIKSQLKLAEKKLDRLKKLIGINGVSQEEYEMQENEHNSFKADENYMIAQIAKTNITAPFDGFVGLKNVSEGSFVNASTPLFSLIQTQPLYVEFSLPEKYANLIKKGTVVNFSLDNMTSVKTNTATLFAIEPKVEEATKTIRARAIYNGSEDFYPGSFAKVFLNIEDAQNAFMVPTQCIIATLKGQKVFISKNGLAKEVEVKIGIRTEQKIQILEGLTSGDTIIVNGLMSLRNETKLKLLKQIN